MNKKIFNIGGLIIIFTILLIFISLISLYTISLMKDRTNITDLVSQIFTGVTLISLFIFLFVGIPLLITGGILKNPEQKKEHVSSNRYCPNCKNQIPLESRICPFCRRDFERFK